MYKKDSQSCRESPFQPWYPQARETEKKNAIECDPLQKLPCWVRVLSKVSIIHPPCGQKTVKRDRPEPLRWSIEDIEGYQRCAFRSISRHIESYAVRPSRVWTPNIRLLLRRRRGRREPTRSWSRSAVHGMLRGTVDESEIVGLALKCGREDFAAKKLDAQQVAECLANVLSRRSLAGWYECGSSNIAT